MNLINEELLKIANEVSIDELSSLHEETGCDFIISDGKVTAMQYNN